MDSGSEAAPPQIEVNRASPEAVADYVKTVGIAVLGGSGAQADSLAVVLDGAEAIKKFINEPQSSVLVVERSSSTRDQLGGGDPDTGDETDGGADVVFSVRNDFQYRSERSTSVVFIKKEGVVDGDKRINDQFRIIVLNEGDPYDTLLSIIGKAVNPFFKKLIKEKRSERDGDKLAPSVERNLNEAEVALLHLQQNIVIPEINLVINQHIMAAIQKASKEGRKAKVDDLGELANDSTFLHSLQSGVQRWIKEIRKVTSLERDPSSGSSLQEMTFWLNLERALQKISQKRESEEVVLTMETLKSGKRFHATVSFDNDTGLSKMMETVKDYNSLMKEFPLNELVAANDMASIKSAIMNIFAHMKKIRSTKYPIQRALRLVEAISRDLNAQLLKVLGTRRLMHISMTEFDLLITDVLLVLTKWDDEYDKFMAVMRDLSKKKRDEPMKMTFRCVPIHKKLEGRLTHIRQFRKQHEQFRTVITRVLRPKGGGDENDPSAGLLGDDSNAVEEVNRAYENVKEVECLDVSPDGVAAWEAGHRRYEAQIERVEAAITTTLREQLGSARNAKEMFSIFRRFNALFVRPHIRGAIREYQTQLIHRVKEDIDRLQVRFAKKYAENHWTILTQRFDIPPVSAKINWIRQFDLHLTQYMQRVEDVLGKGWESHIEGRQLKQDCEVLRQKLNVQPLFDKWLDDTMQSNVLTSVGGRVFHIERRVNRDNKSCMQLAVNFSPESHGLHKEVRNLKSLGFRIPLKVVNSGHQIDQIYPHGITLHECIKTFNSITANMEIDKKGIAILVANYNKEIQDLVDEGFQYTWDSYKIDPYVKKMSELVNNYQDRVEEMIYTVDKINGDLAALDTCQYNIATVSALLASIQKAVDQLTVGKYSNLNVWVEKLDAEVESKLAKRAEDAIKLWTLVYSASEEVEEHKENNVDLPAVHPVVIEVRLTSQTIYISPSIENAKAKLLEQLVEWHSVVSSQPRVHSTSYQLTIGNNTDLATYKDVLNKLPGGLGVLQTAYSTIDSIMQKVDDYVKEWLRYQALWDLQSDMLYDRLGTDIPKWMKTLVEIRKSRNIFDTQDTRKEIFPIVVDYGRVQSKVTLKYDNWHKEVLQKFGTAVGQWREELESQGVDSGTTSDAVALITYVQSLKKKTKVGQESVEQFRAAHRLLSQQRFQFPNQWLYAENVEGEWSALTDILMRKDSSIQSQVSNLQSKVLEEDELVEKRTLETLAEWERAKPVEGAQRPQEALIALGQFEQKMNKLTEDREKMRKARNALDMADTGVVSEADRLVVATEELADLKGVWQNLTPVYAAVDEMKEKTWMSVQPRKLRQSLDELMNQLKHLPVKYKSYKSYEYAKQMMHTYSKMNVLVSELKSEALKERHWRQMMKELRVNWNLTDLTLGQVWDADLQKHDHIIKQILLVAQGELALEEFLKQMKDVWQSYEVELVNYQNKTRLIKGWDDLFNKLKEHQNSLAAMKLSPYYKQFAEDAVSWEEKLNKISSMFDVWIDVQRRWVYLEGLFTGSADIATLLPVESARFSSISTEFLALMKKVTASPRILDVVHMQGAQRLLERLADMLAKIQKALGEYLERERSSFPRFYFVGDEDLLEIMGNSKDIARLQKHLKKMFAGVNAIDVGEEDKQITGFHSREGEHVELVQPVATNGVRINDWLRALECEMRNTLARRLAAALVHFAKLDIDTVNPEDYMEWLDKYPAQVIGLTAEIWWSNQMETALADGKGVEGVEKAVSATLSLLADSVLKDQPAIRRKKIEALITEFVHKRDTCRKLAAQGVKSQTDFGWLQCMRFYFDPKQPDPVRCCIVKMANAQFFYGFEYLGIQERLVRTPLTDRCFLTMTQALHSRLGGSPFGPAGTGKTESVKALGHQLGRYVLVFNCDETFDFQAMGRILVGLCQVGAWGCFDEFNRLEERMLSAVSQQIQTIQEAVRAGGDMSVDLVGKRLNVNANIGIFITMNPGYSGRSNLPDNLKQITNLNHGLMLVGSSGSGKTTAWKVLLKALERWEKIEGVSHVIDAKAMSKDALYGTMDPNTREWTDGLFTSVIRRIIDNVRGESDKRQWIVFDGDVDPEWVENLNSVLDDNKLLTLPNGERLGIPPNVRIIFEVADLKYATLATVSRCGMVWFSEEVVTTEMLFEHYLSRLRSVSIEGDNTVGAPLNVVAVDAAPSRGIVIQRQASAALAPHFAADGVVPMALKFALTELEHIMMPTQQRMLSSFFAMMNYSVRTLIGHDFNQGEFHILEDQIEAYAQRSMLTNLVWAFSGDGKWKCRQQMSDHIRKLTTITLPPNEQACLIDYEVQPSGEWQPWLSRVPSMEIEAHRVAAADLVVPTVDTVRHEMLLAAWLSEHKPLVLCGPPGSGKTMTLLAALRSQQDMDVVNVNFSSSTTPELLMKTFDHYCEYRRTPNGVVLAPTQLSRWLVIFCDEINLPSPDKYGTQRVISFIRQLVELNGFYRPSDHAWVSLERIQFVGACNPPTDPGRHPMTLRFLRHVPVVYVDYPGQTSLIQIYGTFNRAMLKMVPAVRSLADALTNAMVDVYLASQEHFTQDDQPHYVYSPRELTRWVRGISEAITPLESLSADELVRLWAHEALRLFQDRLVSEEERKWTDELVDSTAEKYFGGACNTTEALRRPMLYSCWMSMHYVPVTRDELKDYVSARLKGFYEEALDVQLVLFDQMLDHVLRIDRIFRQPQGHLLLIGTAGAGKTTMCRFVAWLNGISVFQLKVHSKYTAADFDEDMRCVLRRAGCRNEKMCFIMDESNMLDTGFLERLNTLLANGEVPGLFEGDEHTTLMTQIKEGAQRQGLMLDSHDELYKWFTLQVMRNLHVVFTMNPSGTGLREKASTSPALFNRCVLNWYGDWSDTAFYQVGTELTNNLDMSRADYEAPFAIQAVCELLPSPPNYRHAVINTLVHCHKAVQKLNEQEQKRGHRITAVTPRHFLDLIQHFKKLFHEKRSELEEEKVHLNIGLNKIKETEEQVEEMQKSLTLKSRELEVKKSAADAKLKQMMVDQQKAEDEKRLSEQLQAELKVQLSQISIKTKEVQKDLSQVEPAVEEAQQAVKGIRKQQLVEVRSMASPPVMVKLALEAICILLGENAGDWKAIRGVMVKDDFMPRLLGFDTDSLTPQILSQMEKYMNNPDFDYEKVNRASTACGPMVKWAKAQLLYSQMLHSVEPLRNELNRLERDANNKKSEGEAVQNRIVQLESSISAYKDEYAELIGEAEMIKSDLTTVQTKVGRSTELLSSLRSERDRWSGGCDGFDQHMDTLIGDAMLAGAFLSYAGYFDQQLRDILFHRWAESVQSAGVRYRHDLARIEYLSTVDDRLQWQKNLLPVDDLCSENAVMLHRFNRYPLIIDPSGQAAEFIMQQFAGKNIQKTSFLDDSFRKNLESALRFGNSLLVQDVESYDPILNPVLNREVKRTGGRVLITIGDQDIDLSPSFQIFMLTRDSSIEFSPDLCSRVTFVNFTVTSSSLASQCLNQVLRSERPDVDKKRNDLLKLQGEFAVRLRQLEKALLNALNESKGKILDDNSVIGTLEKLKTESSEISKKAAETDKVMAEVEAVSSHYQRLAAACSQIYHSLQQLNEVHFLYHYSLDFLLDIFTCVLKSTDLLQSQDHMQRLQIITVNLFQTVYRRVSRGMLHTDKVLLALLLMRIHIRGVPSETAYEPQWDLLLGRTEVFGAKVATVNTPAALSFLTPDKMQALVKLSKLPGFEQAVNKLASDRETVGKWLSLDNPEVDVPVIWEKDDKLSAIGEAMNELVVVHALRSDRFMASAHRLVTSVFGDSFMQQDKVIDLRDIIENEVSAADPILLCSATGYDASGKIEDLGVETGRQVTSIAIGSAEGFSQAYSALTSASKAGRWVLLKNVHLAPQWLGQLEKRLHTLKPHAQFRLFLTAEIHPKLPTSVLLASRLVVFEPATGLKANLLRSLASLPPQRLAKAPVERSRLYLLVCWLHALVQERLRYTPLGWANAYEFSDADLRVACDTLDAAVDTVAQGRANVAPEKLPWTTLRTLLSQCIYGGKIDNHFDQVLLDCVLEKIFTAKAFEPDHVLVAKFDGENSLCTPDATQRDQLISWVEGLKAQQLPSWLGLSNNAEKVLLTQRGEAMLRNMLKVSDDELAFSGDGEKEVKPQWMAQLGDLAQQWLKLVPKDMPRLKRTVDNIKDPMFRYFEREINLGASLLQQMRHDLEEVLSVCRAERKQSNETRSLASSLQRGQVPVNWQRYTVPHDVTVMDWVMDFAERIKQLIRIGSSDNLRREEVWLGGTFSAEAYVTATRQQVAQANTWSLEQLHLHVHIGRTDRVDVFRISGIEIRGAEALSGTSLQLSDEVKSSCECVEFAWKQEPAEGVRLPLYLYGDRKQLVASVAFTAQPATAFFERGVAIVANAALN